MRDHRLGANPALAHARGVRQSRWMNFCHGSTLKDDTRRCQPNCRSLQAFLRAKTTALDLEDAIDVLQ